MESRMNKKHFHNSKSTATKTPVEPLVIADDRSIVVLPEDNQFLDGWKPFSEAKLKDVAESQRTAKAIKAQAKQCWFNARKTILCLPEYSEASYIEGWAVCGGSGTAFEHGWIVKEGTNIDPTLPEGDLIYFPGLEFPGRRGINAFLATKEGKKCKRSPFFYAFGWGGRFSPSFQQAFNDATAYQSSRFLTHHEGETK